MVNVIVSLISPLPLLLLVYRTARGFCVLILYPAALPKLLISSNSLLLPWVYPTWDSLCFLDLDDSFLCHIRDFFGYYLFKYFLRSFLSPSFSSTTIMWMLMCLMLFQRSLRLSSFLFILFFFLFHGSDFHHAIFQLLLLSHFSCVRLCDSIDGSPQGSPAPGILQARTLKWVAISFSNAWKWKVKVKSLSHSVTPWTAAYQAPPSMGFSRQEYWSGVPLPSPFFSWLTHSSASFFSTIDSF